MSQRVQKKKTAPAKTEEVVDEKSLAKSDSKEMTDEILDEIDAVLEDESFVVAYVQKGGQ